MSSSKGPEAAPGRTVVQRLPLRPPGRVESEVQNAGRHGGTGPALRRSWRPGSWLSQLFLRALVWTPLWLPIADAVQQPSLSPLSSLEPPPGFRCFGEAAVTPAPPSGTFFVVWGRVQTKIKQVQV